MDDARGQVLRVLQDAGGIMTPEQWQQASAGIDGAGDALQALINDGTVFEDGNGAIRKRSSGVEGVGS